MSLTNPHFRLLWVSMLFSFTGLQMSFTAQGFLTYDLTGTATSLGVVSLGWGIPLLALSLVGGVAADRLHKRWLMMISHGAMAVSSLITAVLIQTDVIAVWHIFVLALVTGTVFAFNVPARQAWIPELVGRDQLMNAVALNSSAFTLTGIVGPAAAGGLIAVPFVGMAGVYYLMAACFAIVVLGLLPIPGGEPVRGREHASPFREIVDGLNYIRRHPVLPTLLLMGFVPIVLAMPYRQFFPVFQEEVYGVGSIGLGVMGAFLAVGALVGSLGVASLTNTSRRSLIQLVGGLGFGVALVLFAAAPVLSLGLVALLFVGLTSNGYWALNNTMVLGSTDPKYYGRVMSVYMLSWSIMPFATMPESALADQFGVQKMVAGVGVLLVLLLLAIMLLVPGHRRLRDEESRRV
ncbi:MAG: MFS transporter [Chloroflexi bacterium]|nr:MFS transporter [Chloroflexota bacterium]